MVNRFKCSFWPLPAVFPGGEAGESIKVPWHVWHWVRDRAGLKDARIYDLRHMFASVGADGASACRLLGGCSATHNRGRRSVMRTSPMIRCASRGQNHNSTQQCGKAGRRRDDATAASVMSGAKEIVESIVELLKPCLVDSTEENFRRGVGGDLFDAGHRSTALDETPSEA